MSRAATWERFRQVQKMEASVSLPAAWPFSNLLTIINGYGDMILGCSRNASNRNDHGDSEQGTIGPG